MPDPKRPEFMPEQIAEVRRLQGLYPDKQGALLPVLRLAQDVFGYVSLEVEEYVAGLFEMSPAHVHEVVTFYTLFFQQPTGRHVVSVCHNLSCHLLGSKSIVEHLTRRLGVEVPVLMLTARGQVSDRVAGLDTGADDYLVKPFAFSELLARLEALERRAKSGGDAPATMLRVADLEMDLLRREVRRGGEPIELQPREFQLLEFLLRHAGQVVTRTMLLEGVWDYHFDPQTNVIDVHISRLRAKIDRGFDKPLLHTVRGVGYRLDG